MTGIGKRTVARRSRPTRIRDLPPSRESTTTIGNTDTKRSSWERVFGTSIKSCGWPDAICSPSALISPELLDQLEHTEGTLDPKLDPVKAKASKDEQLHLDEKTFRWMHNEDGMATEKVAERIRKFNSEAHHLEDCALSQVAEKVG